MRLRDFLWDHWVTMAAMLAVAVFSALLLVVLGAGAYAAGYVAALIFLGWLVPLFMEYARRREFYNSVRKGLDRLDKKYLLSEILDEPSFEEGKLLYEALRETEKSMNDEIAKYRLASQDYREFVETWVHEIKTPIAACRLILENNPGKLSHDIKLDFTKIENYVEQALFYARSGSVEKDYALRRVKLREMVNASLKKNSALLIESGVRIKTASLEQTVLADPKWMEFILGQILTNAIKYRTASPEVDVSASVKAECVTLTLEDNGIGIPQKDLGRVFEKGFTGENGRMFRRSTGIGLYLCKKLCDKMGLGVSVASVQGVGTAVSIVFPIGGLHGMLLKPETLTKP